MMNSSDKVVFPFIINGLPVQAVYTQTSINEIFLPFLREITDLRKKKGKRILILLAAPPAAGKSTLCEFLKMLSVQTEGILPLTVIGMDGFHRYQDDLLSHTFVRDGEERPLTEIKGAPVTFDLGKLTDRIRLVASGEVCTWPLYDRTAHNPKEDALTVDGEIVLLEGNYLLLDEQGWRDLRMFADITVRIIADEEDLRERLISRKVAGGTEYAKAVEFVNRSDLANARLCLSETMPADKTWILLHDGEYVEQRDS